MTRLGCFAAASAVALAAAFGFWHWRTRNVSRVQRGWRVAQDKGCFTCHGPDGTRGVPIPGHGLDEAPTFTADVITMYARDEAEIREWILEGLPRRVREDPKQMKLRERAVILMPAWRGVLSDGELDDVVAYVKAATDFEAPAHGPAAEGREVARRLGCFGCHGPQGRGSPPNVRSLKGYIPSWDGADFPELARDEGEIREWILDGSPRRLRDNRVARWFLERQPITMPSYRGHLSEEDVSRLVAYIGWVRQHPY